MTFFSELAKHTETAYGVVALICTLAIVGIMKYAPKSRKIFLIILVAAFSIAAVLFIHISTEPPTQVFNQSNNGSDGVFNNNSGSGVQINNEQKK